MDPVRFDTLAKTLSATGTRRGALAALLSGALSLLGVPQGVQGRKRRGGGGVTIEGPCGDGSGPDNACTRDRDCCTRICNLKRCRCRRQGEPCIETRNCCQGATGGLVCSNEGTCQTRCAGVTCTPLDECHEAGTCDPATGTCSNPEKAPNTPCGSGGHCCGGSCEDVDCCNDDGCDPGLVCNGGTCQPPCPAGGCASGCCNGTSCQEGTSKTACGQDGVTCVTCGSDAAVSCTGNGTCLRGDCLEGGCSGNHCVCRSLDGGGIGCVNEQSANTTCYPGSAACAANCSSGGVCLGGPRSTLLCGFGKRACAPACAAT